MVFDIGRPTTACHAETKEGEPTSKLDANAAHAGVPRRSTHISDPWGAGPESPRNGQGYLLKTNKVIGLASSNMLAALLSA